MVIAGVWMANGQSLSSCRFQEAVKLSFCRGYPIGRKAIVALLFSLLDLA